MGVLAKIEEARSLNEKQRAFVEALLKPGATNQSALEAAGYSEATSAATILASTAVQAALRAGRRAIIRGELGGDALDAMRDMLKPTTPAATRFQAAKWVLEHGEEGQADGDKPLSEMSAEELMDFVRKAEAELAEAKAARFIDVTPNNGAQRDPLP